MCGHTCNEGRKMPTPPEEQTFLFHPSIQTRTHIKYLIQYRTNSIALEREKMKLLRHHPMRCSIIIRMRHDEDDEDASTSFETCTFDVVRQCHKAEERIAGSRSGTSSPRRRVVVSFDESRNVYHQGRRDVDEDEIRAQWFSAKEMKEFKSQAGYLAREIYRLSDHKTDSGHACLSYTLALERVYSACCQTSTNDDSLGSLHIDKTDRENFDKWISVSTSRMGLERMCVRQIAFDKRARRKDIVKAVNQVQQQTIALGANKSENDTATLMAERVRAVSQTISRPSRLFAQQLAMARVSRHYMA